MSKVQPQTRACGSWGSRPPGKNSKLPKIGHFQWFSLSGGWCGGTVQLHTKHPPAPGTAALLGLGCIPSRWFETLGQPGFDSLVCWITLSLEPTH